ncbi:MAG: hypothetical protein LBT40_15240 [Deltaproteobacteria bacterium]|nr:hypothetical protein [Deltaproteobacteria bacterium]
MPLLRGPRSRDAPALRGPDAKKLPAPRRASTPFAPHPGATCRLSSPAGQPPLAGPRPARRLRRQAQSRRPTHASAVPLPVTSAVPDGPVPLPTGTGRVPGRPGLTS